MDLILYMNKYLSDEKLISKSSLTAVYDGFSWSWDLLFVPVNFYRNLES